MLLAAPETAQERLTAAWSRGVSVAGKIENTVNAPIYDVASLLKIEATWLTGFLFAVKCLVTGAAMTFEKRRAP